MDQALSGLHVLVVMFSLSLRCTALVITIVKMLISDHSTIMFHSSPCVSWMLNTAGTRFESAVRRSLNHFNFPPCLVGSLDWMLWDTVEFFNDGLETPGKRTQGQIQYPCWDTGDLSSACGCQSSANLPWVAAYVPATTSLNVYVPFYFTGCLSARVYIHL